MSLSGQTLWPGDVTNNGVVNTVDALYWSIANEASGPKRQNPSSQWVEQTIDTLWAESFPDGTNYAYADCNGDGIVDDTDLDIIKEHLGLTHGTVIPDVFSSGGQPQDPALVLDVDGDQVDDENQILVNVLLGSEENPISNFYGVGFTLKWKKELVNKNKDIQISLKDQTWLNESNGKAKLFFKRDLETGTAEVAILRKKQEEASGGGIVASISIVMEDIIFDVVPDTFFIRPDSIRMISVTLDETPVTPVGTTVIFEENGVVSVDPLPTPKGMRIYPNPVQNEENWIELVDPSDEIRQIEVFSITGQRVFAGTAAPASNRSRVEWRAHPPGLYVVRVYTRKGIFSRKIIKS